MAEYRLDLIADSEGFVRGVSEAKEKLSELGEQAIKSGKETARAFDGGMEKFNMSLKDQFIFLGKAEQQFKKLKTSIKASTDTKEIEALNKQVKGVTDSVVNFNMQLEKTEDVQKSLKAQLRENKAVLAEMEDQGLDTTDAFTKLQITTGKLQDQIADTNERIKFFASDTRGIDSAIALTRVAAAGFAIGQGAAALFGAENENVQKALLKVNAAMAILTGLQEIQQALQKQSIARLAIETALRKIKIFVLGGETVATEGLTVAERTAITTTKALNAALLFSGVGAAILIIGSIANAMGVFGSETDETTKSIDEQKDSVDNIVDSYDDWLTSIKAIEANRKGGITDLKVELEALKSKGATEVEIFEKQQQIRRKELGLLQAIINEKTIANRTDKEEAELQDLLGQRKLKQAEIDSAVTEFNKQQSDKRIKLSEKEFEILSSNNANRIAAMKEGRDKEQAALDESQRKELISAKKQGLDITLLKAKFAREQSNLKMKFSKEDFDNQQEFNKMFKELEKERDDDFFKDRMTFIDNYEKIKLLELDIEFETGDKSISEARRISKEKLKIEIQAAKDRMALLKGQDGAEAQIKALQLAIAKAQNELDTTDGKSLFESLGLGDLSEKDLQNLQSNLKTVSDSIKSVLTDISDSALSKNESIIANLNEQINTVKNNISEQQKARNEGRANNLAAEKQHLSQLETAKEAALEREKKLLKQKLNIDAATQISSLVTASAKIYESWSGLPIIGQIAAVASIAAMFAAFASYQIKARQSINQQTFKHGGEIKGKRHDADGWGGERFSSPSGDVYIEDGEYVVNRSSAKKYRALIEAINNDNLKQMLEGTGVVLNANKVDSYKNAKDSFVIKSSADGSSTEIESLRKDFNVFRNELKNKTIVTYKDGYRIETRGNNTTRIKTQ